MGFSDGQNGLRFFDLFRGPPHTFAAASRPRGAELRFDPLHASAMKPAPFKYIAASSLEHALSLKAEYGDEAKFLAGGQTLMPPMTFRLAHPPTFIDLNQIEDLPPTLPSDRGDSPTRP